MGHVGVSKYDEGDANFSFLYGWAFVPWLVDWWFCCGDGLRVEDFGCHSWLQVDVWEASQSNCCLCLNEGWHLEKDNECFSRCHCSCQMLLGIYTPCARLLFSSLDVCSHFSPVVAWSCCQPSWPIKRWKCQCDLWHRRKVASLSVFFKIDSLVDHPVRGLFPAQYVLRRPTRGALAAHSRSFVRSLGLELCSFRALLFCLVFDCGMGCMSLSYLVKVWVLLKLQSIAFFYKVDCQLFLPFIQLFLFHFSFSRDLR